MWEEQAGQLKLTVRNLESDKREENKYLAFMSNYA